MSAWDRSCLAKIRSRLWSALVALDAASCGSRYQGEGSCGEPTLSETCLHEPNRCDLLNPEPQRKIPKVIIRKPSGQLTAFGGCRGKIRRCLLPAAWLDL